MYYIINKFVGASYWRAKMYADRFAYCPLVSHCEYPDATNRQTTHGRSPDRYITLIAICGQRN